MWQGKLLFFFKILKEELASFASKTISTMGLDCLMSDNHKMTYIYILKMKYSSVHTYSLIELPILTSLFKKILWLEHNQQNSRSELRVTWIFACLLCFITSYLLHWRYCEFGFVLIRIKKVKYNWSMNT